MPQLTAQALYYIFVIAYTAYTAYDGQRQKRVARQRAKDAYNASLQDRLVMLSTVDGARSRVYGQVRNVDGIVFKGAWGTNNQYYTMVVALAGHECQSIDKVYFNDQELTLTSDGAGGFWVTTAPYGRTITVSDSVAMTVGGGTASVTLTHTPVSGSVTITAKTVGDGNRPASFTPTVVGNLVSCASSSDYTGYRCNYQYTTDSYKARVWKYLGTDTQNIGTDLLASRFPALINTPGFSDRFAGICCLVVELDYDQDAFPMGVPNVTALIKGYNKVYDPRTGLSAWSQNPALIARDWSLYANAGGCLPGEIVETDFLAAANACDISTAFVTAAGTETRPLYQCDIVCKLDAQPHQRLEEIVESMAGKWGWAGGQLTLVAGVYRAPVDTITEDWLSGTEDMGVVKDPPRADAVNVYRASISDADIVTAADSTTHAYAAVPVPEVRSEEYIAADGQELPREVSLGGVTHQVHAQHICAVLMRDERFGTTMSVPCKMHAWKLRLFEVVRVTLPFFGFENQEFEVIGWKFSVDKGVILTLKKFDPSIFDIAANFPLPNAQNNTSLVLPWKVPTITGLTATSGTAALADGTQAGRVLVTWNPVTDASVTQSGKVEVQYADATTALPSGDWATWPEEGSASSAIIPGLLAGKAYLFRVRAINTLRVRGNWSAMIIHIVAPAPGIGGDNLLLNSSFEIDVNADGLADSWTAYTLGTTGTVTNTTPASGFFGAKLQRLAATNLGGTSGDRVGISQTVSVSGAAGMQAVLSAYLMGGTGSPRAVMQVDWRDVSNVSQGVTTSGEIAASTTGLVRSYVTGTIPATAVSAIVTIFMTNRPAGAGAAQLNIDAAMLQLGGVMTDYAPNSAEILAGAVDTLQLAGTAATDVFMDTNASFVPPATTPTAVFSARNLPAAGWYEITVTGRYTVSAFTSVDRLAVWYQFSGAGVSYGDGNPEYAITSNGQVISFTQALTINATGAGPWQIVISSGRLNNTSSGTLTLATCRTTQLKR